MRTTVVYILRLLVDDIEPDALRGILRDVTSGEEHAFSNEQGMLKLLHSQLNKKPQSTVANQTDQIQRRDA
jgi:hypothetical protein